MSDVTATALLLAKSDCRRAHVFIVSNGGDIAYAATKLPGAVACLAWHIAGGYQPESCAVHADGSPCESAGMAVPFLYRAGFRH
jgi:hypothetical protein